MTAITENSVDLDRLNELLAEAKELFDAIEESKTPKVLDNWEEIHEELNIKNDMLFEVKKSSSQLSRQGFLVSLNDKFVLKNGYLIKLENRREIGYDDIELTYFTKKDFNALFKRSK